MLRSTQLSVCICKNILNNNKCYRRIEPRELRYPCRYFASSCKDGGEKKSRDPCAKEAVKDTKGLNLPDDDCAQPISPTCKRPTMGAKMPGRPAVMDQLPKPSVDCKWEKDHKQTAFKKTFHLIAGIILLAIALVPLYNNILPTIEVPVKEESDLKPVKKKSKKPRPIQKTPYYSSDIPDEIPYLLIGGGTASFSAFRAIKSVDPKAQVLVIGNEPYYPYMRPPLSKEMFYVEDRTVAAKLKFKQWNGTERSLFYEPDDFYSDCKELLSEENGGVAVARGWTVKQIDPTTRTVTLEDGKKIKYQKCLLATGTRPNNHPVFEEAEDDVKNKVSLFRNVFDYEELENVIEDGAKCIAIIGGSFLGSELACALARRGKKKNLKVVQIFKENGNMGKILPDYLSKWTTTKVKNEGVLVMPNCQVVDAAYKEDDDALSLALDNGKSLVADHVILALGVKPNTDLADSSQLELDKEQGGFLVNAELEARSNLYVAGDCACFYDAKLGRRRVEHHDHAVVSGRLAGENMTGAGKPYFHQSMFWSDLGPEVGFEAIGIVDSNLPTVGVYAKMTKKDKPKAVQTSKDSDGMRSSAEDEAAMAVNVDDEDTEAALDEAGEGEKGEGEGEEGEKSEEGAEKEKKEKKKKALEDYGKGVIFYLRDGIVVGIVLWNVFNRMSVARQVLSDEKKYEDLNEVAKLFNIHKD